MTALLIAATDTDCGKTVLTCALTAYWQRYCQPYRLGLLKPVQSGVGDRERYQQLFQLDQSLAELNPLFYEAPLAPPVAAALQHEAIDLSVAWQAFRQLSATRDWVIVEGVGGLGSPITDDTTVADLAAAWRLPTVLVVPVKLGAIANAVANVALAKQTGIHLVGFVLNCVTPCSPERMAQLAPTALIERLTQTPYLGTIPHLSSPDNLQQLAEAARQLTLEALMPQSFWALSR
ncbi:MAG: ATP-dependent dethiobiotin synthetase BioD [Leptolyngbya sp. SIO4C1]|nr:ATP-dependent dethiobiotin synthetase BioD [Leptolyngbya sp. SIO4C1]